MNKKVNYTIVDKDGKVVEDASFNDYDKLADHMLELADKWYQGVYDPNDKLNISTYDENGDLIFEDTATFGETENVDTGISESFDFGISDLPDNGSASKGFGGEVKSSTKRPRKKN